MGIFEEQVLSGSIESFVGHLTSCGTCWKVSGEQDKALGLRGRYGESMFTVFGSLEKIRGKSCGNL